MKPDENGDLSRAAGLRWPITRCYGRGKTRADIILHRLPRELQVLNMCVGPSEDSADTLNQFSDALHGGATISEMIARGRGRGKMLVTHLTQVTENTSEPGNVSDTDSEKYKEKEAAFCLSFEPFVYNTDSFKRAPRASTIIMRSDIDLDFVPHYGKSKDYDAQCQEEFPALGVSRTGMKSRKSKTLEGKTSIKVLQTNSVQCSQNTLENISDMFTADGDVNIHRSSKSLVLLSNTDRSNPGEGISTGQSGQEAIVMTDSARDSVVTISSGPSLAGYADEGGELPNKDNKIRIQAEINCTGDSNQNCRKITGMADVAALATSLPIDDAVAPWSKEEAAVKKKGNGGWRLDGPLVVHFEGVPKHHCGKLKQMVKQLATVVDEERKNQKSGRSLRFLFETEADCKYVVSCLNGASNIFEADSEVKITCYCL